MNSQVIGKKKTIILTIIFIILGLTATAGVVFAFLLNYNTFLPSAPSILDDGKNIIITTNLNENYKACRFRFVSTTGNEIIVESKSNVLDVEKYQQEYGETFALNTSYNVSVCYVGETEGSNTDYSATVQWTYTKQLDAPVLIHNTTNKTVLWNSVQNAESYTVYYRVGNSEYTKITQTERLFNYSNLAGGDVEIFVKASSARYKTSESSNKILVTHTYEMKPIQTVEFDSDSYTLTLTTEEEIEYLAVYIGQTKYIAKLTEGRKTGNFWTYQLNIKQIFAEEKIGVEPYPPNASFSYNGDILYVQEND